MDIQSVDFLRILTFREKENGYFVAQCLETGSIVTADDPDMLEGMIKELLEEEIRYAIEHNNIRNLFSTQAPPEIMALWFKASKHGRNLKVIRLEVKVEEPELDEGNAPREAAVLRAA